MIIKKVGNCLPSLKKWFNRGLSGEHLNFRYYSELKDEITSRLLRSLPKEYYLTQSASFFKEDIENGNCTNWHTDSKDGMLIASYPNPTQIIVGYDPKYFFAGCNSTVSHEEVNQIVRDKKGEIFVPKVGDIYLLFGDVIHRTNPKAYGKPHLCARIWIAKKEKLT